MAMPSRTAPRSRWTKLTPHRPQVVACSSARWWMGGGVPTMASGQDSASHTFMSRSSSIAVAYDEAVIRLSLTKADVTGPAGEDGEATSYPKVTVLIRNDQLVLQSAAGVTLHTVAATAARGGTAPRTWEVDTAEGVFHVTRKAGCGCR